VAVNTTSLPSGLQIGESEKLVSVPAPEKPGVCASLLPDRMSFAFAPGSSPWTSMVGCLSSSHSFQ
jgi:hypothetical protein